MEYSKEETAYREKLVSEIESMLTELGSRVSSKKTKRLHVVKDTEVDEE